MSKKFSFCINIYFYSLFITFFLLPKIVISQQRYQIGACDWMMLKRQTLGAFDLCHQFGCDGLEMDIGPLGKREAFEEAGIIVKNLEVFCVQVDKNEHAHYISVGMIAREFEGIPKVKEQEMVKWEWFDLDKLPKNIFSASKKTIDCFLNHKFYMK